jgi:hypothetical protein
MKIPFFKKAMPVMAFMAAIVGAFAFNRAPETNTKAAAQFLGHYKVNGICTATDVMCQDEVETTPCQSGSNVLYKRLSSTNCPDQLWRIEE